MKVIQKFFFLFQIFSTLRKALTLILSNLVKWLQELFWQGRHNRWIDNKPEIAFIELQSFKRFQGKINSTMQCASQTQQARDEIGFIQSNFSRKLYKILTKEICNCWLSFPLAFAHQVNLRASKVSATNLLQLSSSINSVYG